MVMSLRPPDRMSSLKSVPYIQVLLSLLSQTTLSTSLMRQDSRNTPETTSVAIDTVEHCVSAVNKMESLWHNQMMGQHQGMKWYKHPIFSGIVIHVSMSLTGGTIANQ